MADDQITRPAPPRFRPLGPTRLLAFAAIVLPLLVTGCGDGSGARYETVRIGGERFRLELAVTPAERRRGMAGREHVAADGGMLFVFDRPEVLNFWMKGCLIPLDIIFIDASGRIVSTHTMPVPEPGTPDRELPRYSSYYPAQFAIEVKAGTVDRLGLEESERIDLPIQRLTAHR